MASRVSALAMRAIAETMELRTTFEWRGLGFISQSALKLREEFAAWDAEVLYEVLDRLLRGAPPVLPRRRHRRAGRQRHRQRPGHVRRAAAAPLGGFIIEEGFEIPDLQRIVASMGAAAREAGVTVVTGDTKVVERGKADGLYVNTAGIGVIERDVDLSTARVQAGDRVLVSGTIGDHGTAVMIARGDLELEVDLKSDTAPLGGLTATLLDATDGVRCLRDPTRGGVATVLAELALSSELAIAIDEAALPIAAAVNGAGEILGLDPLYVANEGKLLTT